MTFLGAFTVACLWGVLCYGAAHWYRQALDTRQAKYTTVWINRRG